MLKNILKLSMLCLAISSSSGVFADSASYEGGTLPTKCYFSPVSCF